MLFFALLKLSLDVRGNGPTSREPDGYEGAARIGRGFSGIFSCNCRGTLWKENDILQI